MVDRPEPNSTTTFGSISSSKSISAWRLPNVIEYPVVTNQHSGKRLRITCIECSWEASARDDSCAVSFNSADSCHRRRDNTHSPATTASNPQAAASQAHAGGTRVLAPTAHATSVAPVSAKKTDWTRLMA